MAIEGLLPQRPRRRLRFALTPLADVMFQLLLFFMLSSSLAPYSLISLKTGPGAATETGDDAGSEALPLVSGAAIWTIEAGGLRVRGQLFDFAFLEELAATLQASEMPQVVLIAGPTSAVQDVATVLEALANAGIARVQLLDAPT